MDSDVNLFRMLKHDLPGETRLWVERGIISETQASEILGTYGLKTQASGRYGLGLGVLTTLGLLFLGLAILIIVGRNWEEIPPMLRLFGLLTITFGCNLFGLYQWRKARFSSAKNYLFFGSIGYGASIFLIAQTFHLGGYAPEGIMWWAFGIIAVMIATKAVSFNYLFTALSSAYLIIEGFDGYVPWLFVILNGFSLWVLIAQAESKLLWLANMSGLIYFVNILFHQFIIRSYYLDVWHEEAIIIPYTLVTFIVSLLLTLGINGLARVTLSESVKDYAVLMQLWLFRIGICT